MDSINQNFGLSNHLRESLFIPGELEKFLNALSYRN